MQQKTEKTPRDKGDAESKLKSGKRQDRGGKKARGKTEAMRKQGKRKVEAR